MGRGIVVKEAIHAPAQARFEASIRQRVEGPWLHARPDPGTSPTSSMRVTDALSTSRISPAPPDSC
ncbi:MAG: hypothetical protein R3C32_06715 [Chloroflexota bacterium]